MRWVALLVLVACAGTSAPQPRGPENDHDRCGITRYEDYLGQYLTSAHLNDIRPRTIAGRDQHWNYRGRPDDRIILVDARGLGGLNHALGREIVDLYCGAP